MHFSPDTLGSGTAMRSDGSASAMQVGRNILRLQFGCVESGIGDLQHAEDLVGRAVDDEVAVLVTAQQLGPGPQPVMLRDDLFGLRFGHLRSRQLRLFEEIEADGAAAMAAHRLTNCTTTSLNASLSSPAAV